jgi:hypothetical protein
MVLLHHPRSVVEPDGLRYLQKNTNTLIWGGFTHSFDMSHPLLKFTSWYSNRVRPKIGKILYLDHCIYATRVILEQTGMIKEVEIFEDTELSLGLAKYARPQILPFLSKTSAVRFQTNGIYRQAVLNQFLKLGYHLKAHHKTMNSLYEKNVVLNA